MIDPANSAISIWSSGISPSNPSAATSIKWLYSLDAKIKYHRRFEYLRYDIVSNNKKRTLSFVKVSYSWAFTMFFLIIVCVVLCFYEYSYNSLNCYFLTNNSLNNFLLYIMSSIKLYNYL